MANSTLSLSAASLDAGQKLTATVEVTNLDQTTVPGTPGTPGVPAYEDHGDAELVVAHLADGREVRGVDGARYTMDDGTVVDLEGGYSALRPEVPEEPGDPGTPPQLVTAVTVTAPDMTFQQVSADVTPAGGTYVFESVAAGEGEKTVTSNVSFNRANHKNPQPRTAKVTVKKVVVPDPPPPTTTGAMLEGCSESKWEHPGPWGYMRVYDDDSVVDRAVNDFGAKRLGITFQNDPQDPAEVVRRLKALVAKFPGVLFDYCNGNEVDRDDAGHTTDAEIGPWARASKAMQDAIKAAFPNGNVTMGADFTTNQVRLGRTQKFYDALKAAGYDAASFISWFSMYPAGRKDNPPTETDMAVHIGRCLEMAAKNGAKLVGCWEIGTPLSRNYDRPTLVAKWAPYLFSNAKRLGMRAVAIVYWDSWKGTSGDPDNRLQNDAPKTANAFRASVVAANKL